jgi:outer membrane murein-binding lipoprotein Lpp
MKATAWMLALVLGFGALAGCSGSDSGDVEKAKEAAEKAPKSVDELPADMPPQARANAAAAIQQAQARTQFEGEAQKRAMEAMRKQQEQQGGN